MWIIVFFISNFTFALDPCEYFEKTAQFMDHKKVSELYRANKLKGLSEPIAKVKTLEEARNFVYKNPMIKELGFGDVSAGNGWEKFTVNMERSILYGKRTGWEKKLPNNDYMKIRLDYDPVKGAHYNVDMRIAGANGKRETIKYAVAFDCAGKPCTEKDVLKMAELIK
jgi:hypothetical protein